MLDKKITTNTTPAPVDADYVYNNDNFDSVAEAKEVAERCTTAGATLAKVMYNPFALNQPSAERAYADVETIKPRSRDQYVDLFRKTEERTARATLKMCRVVYEAKQSLAEHDFADFCTAIGHKDKSSVIRKYCAIGKLQPRLVKHAEYLPHEWSKIYTITQIPARQFDNYVESGYDFRKLKGKELTDLLEATRQEKQIDKLLPRDKDSQHFVFAKIMFTKSFVDVFDWRMTRKALAEVESRLPIRVQFVAEADRAYEWTKANRFNAAKQNAWEVEFNPSKWDYGVDPIADAPADAAETVVVQAEVQEVPQS